MKIEDGETIFIDEREFIEKFVGKAQKANQRLSNCYNRRMIEYGLNHNHYLGGLSYTISSKEMSLERNINNLLAVYTSNYAESIFFQCENIKYVSTFDLVSKYLRAKGLEDDFLKFKDKAQQKQIAKMP